MKYFKTLPATVTFLTHDTHKVLGNFHCSQTFRRIAGSYYFESSVNYLETGAFQSSNVNGYIKPTKYNYAEVINFVRGVQTFYDVTTITFIHYHRALIFGWLIMKKQRLFLETLLFDIFKLL